MILIGALENAKDEKSDKHRRELDKFL